MQIDANTSPSILENAAAAVGFRSDKDASTASDSAATRPRLSVEVWRRSKLERIDSKICGVNWFLERERSERSLRTWWRIGESSRGRRPVRKSRTEEIAEKGVSALMMSDLMEARVWRVSETESSSSIDEERRRRRNRKPRRRFYINKNIHLRQIFNLKNLSCMSSTVKIWNL